MQSNFSWGFSTFFTILFLFATSILFAQTPITEDVGHLSTQLPSQSFDDGLSGDLSKYIDYRTGKAIHEITLFSVEENGYSLPVKLMYSANGAKVNQLASPVGMNWSLSVGGKVTRTVQQIPDEYEHNGTKPYPNSPTPIYSDDDLGGWINNTADVNYYETNFSNFSDNVLKNIQGIVDLAPDQFNMICPYSSIDFTLEQTTGNYRPLDKSNEDWDVERNIPYNTTEIGDYWSFTDVKGIEYSYDLRMNDTSYLYNAQTGIGTLLNNTYHLTEIDVPNRDTHFDFIYDTEKKYFHNSVSYHEVRSRHYNTDFNEACAYNAVDQSIQKRGEFLLDTIISNHYMVVFSYATHPIINNIVEAERYQLQNIVLKSISGQTLKEFVFSYNNSNSDIGKSYLKEIYQKDINNLNQEYIYRFGYYDINNTVAFDALNQDLFGYQNNGVSNTTLVFDEDNNIYPDRDPDLLNMQIGMLSYIESKYKGKVNYYYEENIENTNDYYGGLRVRQIDFDDDNGNVGTYGIDYSNPIGRTVDINDPSNNNNINICHEISTYKTCFNYLVHTNVKTDNTDQEQDIELNKQEYGFFYQNVNITYPDNNGSKEYSFEKKSESFNIDAKISSIKDFDNIGNIVKEVIYSYTGSDVTKENYINIESWVSKRWSQDLFGCNFVWNKARYSYTPHEQKSAWHRLESIETKINGTVSVLKVYEYDTAVLPSNHLTKSERVTNSDGKVHKTNYYYSDSYPHNTLMKNIMLGKNMLFPAWKVEKLVDNVLIDGEETIYSYFDSDGDATGVLQADILPYQRRRYERSWYSNGSITPGIWELQTTIDAYTNGKPRQVTQKHWNTIYYTWQDDLLIQKDFNNHQESYSYYPDNRLLNTSTDIDGQVVTYEYDGYQRLNKIRERNDNVITTIDYFFKEILDPFYYNLYNYTETKTTYTDISNTNVSTGSSDLTDLHTLTYFDGFGKEIQTSKVGYSPNNRDVIFANEYDELGRLIKEYEAYEATTSDGTYNTNFTGSILFTESTYEPSPLGRISTTTPPLWNTSIYSYGSNGSGLLDWSTGVSYPANSLVKRVVEDPNGNKNIVYIDKLGRQIQHDMTDNAEYSVASTRYSYDNKNRLSFAFPPGVTLGMSDLYFKYVYDGADNMTQKKIPDVENSWYIYNDRDLLSAYNNRLLDQQYKWLVTHYDDYGRVTKTGIQNNLNLDNDNLPTIDELLTDNYYDGASYLNANDTTLPEYVGKIRQARVKVLENNGTTNNWLSSINNYDSYGRLVQASENNLLELSNQYSTISTYDYDYADNPITLTTLQNNLSLNYKRERFEYDHSGRLTDQYHKIGFAGIEEHLINQNHTIKDQIAELNLGGAGLNALQSIDYSYNIQGWLTKINDPATGTAFASIPMCMDDMSATTAASNSQPVSGNPDGNDLFNMSINFGFIDNGFLAPAQQNGNVSQISWRTKSDERQVYGFKYDYLNRLTDATYGKYSDGFSPVLDITNEYNTNYSYDTRGNIMTLNRKGMKMVDDNCYINGTIDSLEYVYYPNSNQLQQVLDHAGEDCPPTLNIDIPISSNGIYDAQQWVKGSDVIDPNANITYQANDCVELLSGFEFDPTGGTGEFLAHIQSCDNFPSPLDLSSEGFHQTSNGDFVYDDNGNMTFDPNKDFVYSYNYMNLPYKAVSSDGTKEVQWEYDADGRKLQKKVIFNGALLYKQDYWQGAEYRNDTIQTMYHSIGRVLNTGIINSTAPTWQYEYHLNDHTGNTRVTFSDKDNNGLIEDFEWMESMQYYPFGMRHKGMFRDYADLDENHLVTGKEQEQDFDIGWYDFGARRYDSTLGRWNSVDPLADNYHEYSTYNYVLNNPVIFIDPDGMQVEDTYGVDKDGNITKIDNKKHYDKDGNEVDKLVAGTEVNYTKKGKIKNPNIDVAKGALRQATEKVEIGKGSTLREATVIKFGGNNTGATELFEFLSNNTNVEWSKLVFNAGYSGNRSVVSSSHEEKEEAYAPTLAKAIGYEKIVSQDHSHPAKYSEDRAEIPSTADRDFVRSVRRAKNRTARFRIYTRGRYVGFFGR